MSTVLPPGVRISTTEWPYQVIVVSFGSPIAHLLQGSMVVAPLHSGRAGPAARTEPRLHQLDRPDGAGARVVRGRRVAPPALYGDSRLPRVHDRLRGRV